MIADDRQVQVRVHGSQQDGPTVIFLPGLHGDWTMVTAFRAAARGRVRFVEITYPRTLEWSLADYGQAVLDALAARGITTGWLLGESFSSQVAWKIIELTDGDRGGFVPQGLILSGGFVRHPIIPGVHVFKFLGDCQPMWLFRALVKIFQAYALFRHRPSPEARADLAEFVARRTDEDRQAIGHRYALIFRNDLRPVARRTLLPVYQLSGLCDPIVPWPLVTPWLRRNCPGFRARRVILNADHNVLGTAPEESLEQILRWMAEK
jgi:pimeloyl-ACP methyl ester carboxylesterase